jgi:hypothetical protein
MAWQFRWKIKSNYTSFPHFTFDAFLISSFSGVAGKMAQGTLLSEKMSSKEPRGREVDGISGKTINVGA